MSWKTIVCLAAIGLLVAGCGKKETLPTDEADYEKYFGREFRIPHDRSVSISALPGLPSFPVGGAVELNVMIGSGLNRACSLPFALDSDEGRTYPYLSALVRDETGTIEQITLPAGEGELVTLDLPAHETAFEIIRFSDYYDFEQPGRYQVVLLYSVPEEPLPNGQEPDWTGTTWTSPISVVVE